MTKRESYKGMGYRNTHGAYFEKDVNTEEGYFHFCDQYRRDCVPVIWKHDISSVLIAGSERIHINYCPLCGKKLD